MEYFEQQNLFTSGEGGYVRYRIPAIVMTGKGTILTFCEARKFTGHDSDQIDLFVRRSTDGGRSFGPVGIVATESDVVCGNPAPVLDRATGTIWLPFCKNLRQGDETMICEGKAPRTVWLTCSRDDGVSWEEPWEITASVKPAEWSWYATGPCHGIQLSSGRLLIACDHIVLQDRTRSDPHHSHLIVSDDHGETWQVGGIADEGTNESVALEAADGSSTSTAATRTGSQTAATSGASRGAATGDRPCRRLSTMQRFPSRSVRRVSAVSLGRVPGNGTACSFRIRRPGTDDTG